MGRAHGGAPGERGKAPTEPGRRKKKASTHLIAPEAELGIDEEKVGTESRERYGIG